MRKVPSQGLGYTPPAEVPPPTSTQYGSGDNCPSAFVLGQVRNARATRSQMRAHRPLCLRLVDKERTRPSARSCPLQLGT